MNNNISPELPPLQPQLSLNIKQEQTEPPLHLPHSPLNVPTTTTTTTTTTTNNDNNLNNNTQNIIESSSSPSTSSTVSAATVAAVTATLNENPLSLLPPNTILTSTVPPNTSINNVHQQQQQQQQLSQQQQQQQQQQQTPNISNSNTNNNTNTNNSNNTSTQTQSDIIMQKLWNELQQLIDSQASVMKSPTQESYLLVSSVQKALQDKTTQILREISTLWCKSLLQPQDIGKVRDAVQDLAVIQRQLEVLRNELDTLPFAESNTSSSGPNSSNGQSGSVNGNNSVNGGGGNSVNSGNSVNGGGSLPVQPSPSSNPKVSAALVVKRQPFPLVLRKGEQLGEQDSIIVRLVPLSLSAEVMTITSQVRVQVVCDSHQTSRSLATHELIQPLAINIDPTTLIARFTLHFLDGTKNTPVSLRFSLQILVQNSVPVTLESELTAPFIVITHKDQWRGAAGTMLKRDAFLHQYEIPWPQLANTLQTHFLRATKQAQAAGTHRPLSEFDLVYLNKKFFAGKAMVDQSQFDTFWQWYGAALDTIRHQRPILGLWWQGLVYGFASKDDVNVALAREAPGTFLIRFSESFPGSFAIAYTTNEGVKHYLVTPQDHALHKTLPDFIVAQPQFVNVLQLQISQDPATGKAKLQLVRVNKTAAFESFCTKKPPQPRPLPPGYSSL